MTLHQVVKTALGPLQKFLSVATRCLYMGHEAPLQRLVSTEADVCISAQHLCCS